MYYGKNQIPIRNTSLSLSKVNDEIAIISVNGNLKTIVCKYSVLNSVLNAIDGIKTFETVEALFLQQYGQVAVENFINTLLAENIINIKKNEANDLVLPKTCLIGSGTLFDKTYHAFNIALDASEQISVSDFLASPHMNFDVAVIIPEELCYREILELNSYFVKNGLPFFILYYNGQNLVIGPFVFPWKTACFECHVTHHLQSLNKSSQRLIQTNHIADLMFSWKIPDDYTDAQLVHIADIISADIKKVSKNSANFMFLETEILIAPNNYGTSNKRIYRTISDCNACHGMNKSFKIFDKSITVETVDCRERQSKKIEYTSGGLRSVSESETENLVKRVLANTGLNIQIQRAYNNPFSSIIPVFDSYLKTTHKNNTPYFFAEQVSHGKGINEKQAYFSAAFEIIERLSARYHGEKEIVRGCAKEVAPYNIDLVQFANQIHNSNTSYDKYSDDISIDWVWGQSLITGKPKLIPASMVFLTGAVFRGHFGCSSSSGLSAGVTLEDAILQGLLELIEHDACMIGQANPVQLPIIEAGKSKNAALKDAVAEIESYGYKVINRDYTNDIGLPVIRTWIVNPKDYTSYAATGFGASVSAELALERSVTEAIQSATPPSAVPIDKYARQNYDELLYNRISLYSLYYFQQKDIKPRAINKDISEFGSPKYNSVSEVLSDVINRIQKVIPDCDIVFADLTRKTFGIPVVRVIIAGAVQHLNVPLFAVSPRLFNFQKNMGYSDRIPSYEDLYMGHYPH